MEVVVDSHALLWFVSNNQKLSEKAKRALNKSSKIIVSTIVLLELLYILQKYGQENKFNKLLDNLTSEKYLIYPVDYALVKECAKLDKNLEMHDRLIVATARIFNAPLVSKDQQVKRVFNKTIW